MLDEYTVPCKNNVFSQKYILIFLKKVLVPVVSYMKKNLKMIGHRSEQH